MKYEKRNGRDIPIIPVWKRNGTDWAYLGEGETLPREVLRWSGLLDTNPVIEDRHSLAHYNDTEKGYGFKRIAKLIEAHL